MMCGITGIASTTQITSNTWLSCGRDMLTHRGPDGAGEWLSICGRVALFHRRLSIIDLTPLGHQPMHMPTYGLSIVFNGEIYNYIDLRNKLSSLGHIFHTRSDTEVLLAAYAEWGVDCLNHLNGMFAFAIFDEPNQKIFLARDRAGEKPLYYYMSNGKLYFASELKALFVQSSLPRRINLDMLDCYLAMGFVPGDRCILHGYNKLAPAHAMIFNVSDGSTRLWRYWQPPEFDSAYFNLNENNILSEFEYLFEDAVCRQLVADVPVGILLSGGIDSSLITAMAVRHSNQLRTFSISFPGHGKLDETPYARMISQYFGTNHTELIAEPTSVDLIPILAEQFDEPMADSSMLPTFLVSRLVRQYCKVALGGDGGDELFAGYSHYSRLLRFEKKLSIVPNSFRRLLSKSAEWILPMGIKGRSFFQSLDIDFQRGLPLIATYFDPTTRRNLMCNYPLYPISSERYFESRIPYQSDLLQRSTRMDFENYLSEDILVKLDRASMLNSLELRSPFLDYKLIEFAFGKVSSSLKANVNERKILLRRLAARLLPPNFNIYRKQGFSIPLSDWLKRGPFRDLFWATLNSRDCLFDHRTVKKLLKGQDFGFSNGDRLFSLVIFEIWRKKYHITI